MTDMARKLTRVAGDRARLAGLAAAVVLGVGCSGPATSDRAGARPAGGAADGADGSKAGVSSTVDPGERAREEIAALVRGMNRAIDTWDGPAYLAPFARSDSLVFIGSDSSEVTIGYDALASEILPSFASAREGGRSGAYRHTSLRTGATRDGRFGWWLQEMDYEFEREGERWLYPFRISGFAVRDPAGWRVVLGHASLPVPPDSLHRLLIPDPAAFSNLEAATTSPGGLVRPLPPPPPGEPPFPGSQGKEIPGRPGIRELLQQLARRQDQGADGSNGWSDLLSDEDDLLIVGEGPGDVQVGREGAAPLLAAFTSRAGSLLPAGRVRVWSRDDVAWWYQTGFLQSTPAGSTGERRVLPYRSTGAAIREEGVWKVLEWHADVPVPNDSTDLFSRPVAAAGAR
jgi:hypothetical protein